MKNKTPLSKAARTALPGVLLLALNSVTWNALAQQANATPAAQAPQPAATEQIKQLYGAGNYRAAARLGSEQLLAEPGNTELRYMVANSYAWTGRSREAIEHYKALQGTDHADRARLGMANVYRWNGLSGLAAPLYRQVLAAEPENKDAAEGLAYAMRELRPQTRGRITWIDDSLDTERQAVTVAQGWTDRSLQHGFELEAGALQDQRNELKVNQRDLTLRYAGIANPLKPRLEISAQQKPRSTVFGSAEIQLPNTPVTVGVGRVNWGKMAFDPNALRANLTANNFGVRAAVPSDIGMWRMAYQGYRISDDNVIQDATVQYTPTWQPLKIPQIKFFVGFEGRKARFNSPAYWSPEDGNYLGTIGVSGEWVDRRWERTILVQYGVPLGGEAENSYSASAGVRHWVSESLAVGLNLSAQKSQRTGAYRANTAMLSVQGLW